MNKLHYIAALVSLLAVALVAYIIRQEIRDGYWGETWTYNSETRA